MTFWAVPRLRAAPSGPASAVRVSALFAAEDTAPGHEELLKWINFAILIAALGYFLRKPLGSFFTDRLGSIRKGLDEGRRALEASEARLAAIEEKLRNFERELGEFRVSSERQMEAERQRLKEAAEREADRIMDFARSQIDAAARAAKLDLRRFTAGQALELAESLIRARLDEGARHRLVKRFVETMGDMPPASN